MGVKHTTADVCPNDCIIYHGEHAALQSCPKPGCNAPRYNPTNGRAKKVRISHLDANLQRLMQNPRWAADMMWGPSFVEPAENICSSIWSELPWAGCAFQTCCGLAS